MRQTHSAERVRAALDGLGPLSVRQLALMLSLREDTVYRALYQIGAAVVSAGRQRGGRPAGLYYAVGKS